jgi:acetyltransferase-like isoleucine patch superfamily enzyme
MNTFKGHYTKIDLKTTDGLLSLGELQSVLHSQIFAKELYLGRGIWIGHNCKIGSPTKPIEKLIIGDQVWIDDNVTLQAPEITILDYTKMHKNILLYGRNSAFIGYNCWFGQNTIIDCEGKVELGNGLGVGAYSQLWSHIRHGDVMIGNKYLSFGSLVVEDDVWFVGHCIVSPIHAAKKSMAMVGSVITKDMEENHIYGGCPAKDLTDKIGPPFNDVPPDKRAAWLYQKWHSFCEANPDVPKDKLVVTSNFVDLGNCHSLQFDVSNREYVKTHDPIEVRWMKFLLPEAKFIPA